MVLKKRNELHPRIYSGSSSVVFPTFFPAFLHMDSLTSVWASGEIREHLTSKSFFPFDVKGVHCSPSKNHFFHSRQDKFSFCSLEGKQNRGLHTAVSIRQLKVLMFSW